MTKMTTELTDNDEIKYKMRKLKPELQGVFMKYMRVMCDQETDLMIDFISESRMEIRNTNSEMHREQQALKDSQRSLSRAATSISMRSHNGRITPVNNESMRISSSMSRLTPNRLTPEPRVDEIHNKLAVERYVRKRDREAKKRQEAEEPPPSAPGTPDSHHSFQEETQEIMRDMRTVSARIENERERQAERVRQMKEKKLAKREQRIDQAQVIMEKAGGSDIAKQKDKERQEQKVKELLERKKKERSETPAPRASPIPFLVTPLPDEIEDETVITGDSKHKDKSEKSGDEKEKKEKKKKKKKKEKSKSKDKEKDDVDPEKGEKRKKKKKKKDKEKEKEEEYVAVAWD